MSKGKRDIHRGHRGIQQYRAYREKGKEIAIACKENPKLADAYNQARAQGHDRDKAFQIARASIVAESRAPYKPISINIRDTIREALIKHGGNRTKAAEELGISRSTLRRRMTNYFIV